MIESALVLFLLLLAGPIGSNLARFNQRRRLKIAQDDVPDSVARVGEAWEKFGGRDERRRREMKQATWEERTGGRARQSCGGSRQKDVVTFGRRCQEKVKHFQRWKQRRSSQRETATPDEFYKAPFFGLAGTQSDNSF